MVRPYNDIERLMELFLYIFPKYLDKLSEQEKSREVIKRHATRDIGGKNLLMEANKRNKKDSASKEEVSRHHRNLEETKKDKTIKQISSENEESKENKHIKEELKNKNQMKDEDFKGEDRSKIISEKGRGEENKAKKNIMTKNIYCDFCTSDMKNILGKLIGEKVDICTTGSSVFLLSNVTIVNVEDSIIKLKTIRNTMVILPVVEIVGIRSALICSMKFENHIDSDEGEKFCGREQNLRKYFKSIIGKRVFLQTKGDGDFKYINNKIITDIGKNVVIIEGTVAISICKIILIEEIT